MAKKPAKTEKPGLPVIPGYEHLQGKSAGIDDMSRDDMAIPFIAVLQSNSPQVVDDEPKGAKPGLLFNTATQELYKNGVIFQPCARDHQYVEWIDRETHGGGFVTTHPIDSEIVAQAIAENDGNRMGKIPYPKGGDGHEFVETFYVYGNILSEDGKRIVAPAVLGFTSTKIKFLKKFNTAVYTLTVGGRRPHLFEHRVKINGLKQKNKKGVYFVFELTPFSDDNNWKDGLLDTNDLDELELWKAGADLYTSFEKGDIKADHSKEHAAEEAEVDTEGYTGAEKADF